MVEAAQKAEIFSRARGAFLGLAVGDALGAPVEFMTSGEIREKHDVLKEMVGGGWLRLKPGQVTDDTEMTLCMARAVISAGRWDLRGIAEAFAGWMKSKPIDIGDTCRKGIRNYLLKGELETPLNEWDAGNGAVMRALPSYLLALGDQELLARYAIEQAHLTHNHPVSDAACLCLGRMVQEAILGFSKNRLRRELECLITDFPTFRIEPYRGLATGYVVDTMQTVFHYFFRQAGFEECVVRTVNQGGDADTTGAIAGMLAGAYYGEEQIPRRWLKKLDRQVYREITTLADQLVGLSPLAKEGSADP